MSDGQEQAAGAARWRTARTVGAGLGIVGGLLLAGSAGAASARFASGGWGFSPTGLDGLPVGSLDPSAELHRAGERGVAPNLDVELSGTTSICVLAPGSRVCQGANPALTGPFSVLVSFSVDAIDPALQGSFTLVLTSLVSSLGYGPADVAIELSPVAPVNLDTSAVPGFVWSGGFTPFVRVRDLFDAPRNVYDYLGWTVRDGSRVTFRYDVLTGLRGNSYPQLTANAVAMVVPEPGAALLLGLGLAGLAVGRRGQTGRREGEQGDLQDASSD